MTRRFAGPDFAVLWYFSRDNANSGLRELFRTLRKRKCRCVRAKKPRKSLTDSIFVLSRRSNSQTEDYCLVASTGSGYMSCLVLRDPYHQFGHPSVQLNIKRANPRPAKRTIFGTLTINMMFSTFEDISCDNVVNADIGFFTDCLNDRDLKLATFRAKSICRYLVGLAFLLTYKSRPCFGLDFFL